MNVAYLITSHRLPRQVIRLASTLRRASPSAEIAIHHNPLFPPLDRAGLDALGARLVDPPVPVEWGSFSYLEAVLRSLEWLAANTAFDWVVLISGQDYPVAPLGAIEQRLGAGGVDAFIEVIPCPAPQGRLIDEFALRYHFRWRRVPRRLGTRPVRAAAARSGRVRIRSIERTGAWLGVRPRSTPFSAELACYRGSDWFSLSRAAVERLLEPSRSREELLRHYRGTLLPSESFVQTMLAGDGALRLSGDTRRFSVWDEPNASGPRVLGTNDLDALLSSNAEFARKFDEEIDPHVLDEIDRRVHGFDPGR